MPERRALSPSAPAVSRADQQRGQRGRLERRPGAHPEGPRRPACRPSESDRRPSRRPEGPGQGASGSSPGRRRQPVAGRVRAGAPAASAASRGTKPVGRARHGRPACGQGATRGGAAAERGAGRTGRRAGPARLPAGRRAVLINVHRRGSRGGQRGRRGERDVAAGPRGRATACLTRGDGRPPALGRCNERTSRRGRCNERAPRRGRRARAGQRPGAARPARQSQGPPWNAVHVPVARAAGHGLGRARRRRPPVKPPLNRRADEGVGERRRAVTPRSEHQPEARGPAAPRAAWEPEVWQDEGPVRTSPTRRRRPGRSGLVQRGGRRRGRRRHSFRSANGPARQARGQAGRASSDGIADDLEGAVATAADSSPSGSPAPAGRSSATATKRPAGAGAARAGGARRRRRCVSCSGSRCTGSSVGGRRPPSWRPTGADRLADQLPVLADCYRALRRYGRVDELWTELREASPSAAIVAEGRIVAAGALADQGDLEGAIAAARAGTRPRRSGSESDHLRQWYVLADLYDRAGDAPRARRCSGAVRDVDPAFADVQQTARRPPLTGRPPRSTRHAGGGAAGPIDPCHTPA